MYKKVLDVLGAGVFLFFSVISSARAEEAFMNDTLKTIFSRKSVRFYKNEAVPDDKIMMLVKAAMAAPTAVDKRPWEFIIIKDKTVLKRLAESMPYAKMAAGASFAIVVAADTDRQYGGRSSNYWIMDCSAASQNILLAAESMGLGAVWTSVYPEEDRIEKVREILSLPEHIIPLNLIPVGVPAGGEKPKDKFNEKQIHRDRW